MNVPSARVIMISESDSNRKLFFMISPDLTFYSLSPDANYTMGTCMWQDIMLQVKKTIS